MSSDKKGLAGKLAELEDRINDDETLTDVERNEVLERAKKHVAAQQKEEKIDALFEEAVRMERRKRIPAERFEDVLLDLPKHAAMIKIDNVGYFHGLVYSVPYGVARVIQDTQARMWEHQSEIEGNARRGDQALRPRNLMIGPQHANARTRNINDLQQLQPQRE